MYKKHNELGSYLTALNNVMNNQRTPNNDMYPSCVIEELRTYLRNQINMNEVQVPVEQHPPVSIDNYDLAYFAKKLAKMLEQPFHYTSDDAFAQFDMMRKVWEQSRK